MSEAGRNRLFDNAQNLESIFIHAEKIYGCYKNRLEKPYYVCKASFKLVNKTYYSICISCGP